MHYSKRQRKLVRPLGENQSAKPGVFPARVNPFFYVRAKLNCKTNFVFFFDDSTW